MVTILREHGNTYETSLLDLRNDVVFKAFFGSRRNNKFLLDFLKAILDEQIVSVALTNPNIEPSHANDKSSEMDLRIITSKGEQINVEIQLRGHKAFNERMLIYWAKMYGNQDGIGQSYGELKKAIQIVIADFTLLPKAHFHSMFQLIDPEDGTVFSSHVEIHVLELPKLPKLHNPQKQFATKLEQWLLFIKSDKVTKEALAMESSTMKEAFEEIRRLSEDPKTRALAISREIQLKDQLQREEDAELEGIEQGVAQREKEIVLMMYKKEAALATISDFTGVSLEKVQQIITENIH